jgi:hypothetical protein
MTKSVLLATLALACAPTATTVRNVMGRGFYYQVSNDVKEVEPGHWAGPWANRGVFLENAGQKDEESAVLVESGTFDGVWTSATEMKSCTAKGTGTFTFRDGSVRTKEWMAECKLGLDGLLSFEGRGVYSGTGRFEGMQGSASFTSRQVTRAPSETGWWTETGSFTMPRQ